MERELLRQIWPIFSAEAREHLAGHQRGRARARARSHPARGARRSPPDAHSLKGSAGSLGLADVERLAHAIEGSLAGFDPAEGLSRAGGAGGARRGRGHRGGDHDGRRGRRGRRSTAIEALLGARRGARATSTSGARRSRGGAAEPAPGDRPVGAAGRAVGRGAPDMDALEGAIERLCAPLDRIARRAVATGARAPRAAIAALTRGAAALARRIGRGVRPLADGGPEAPRG